MAFGINPDMEKALEDQGAGEANSGAGNADEQSASNEGKEGDNPDLDKGNTNTDPPATTGKEGNEGGEDNKGGEGAGENTNTPATVEPTEEQVVAFLKSKGGKFEKIEDLFQEKQATENPYSSIIEDPEVKSFLDFKKETGRGFADYQKLQENINDISLSDLAIAKVKSELGSDLSDDDIKAIIEDEISVDLSELDELTPVEKAKLTKYTKDFKANLLADQEKYKTPLAKTPDSEEADMITLENGEKVKKSVYEDHLKKHQAYQKDIKDSVDSVAKTSLSVEFDNAGKKETLTFDYEHDADDKNGMVAMALDLDQTVGSLFRTEKGFNLTDFKKGVWRLDPKNWEKEVSAIVNKAIADTTLRLQQNENNIDFSRGRLPGNGASSGKKDIFSKPNGFGVQFDI